MKTIEEVEILSASDEELLRTVKEVILTHLPTAKILLYGSVARGTQHEDSDYDLFVLTEHALSMDEQHGVRSDIYAIELELNMEVLFSVMFCSEDQWNASAFHGSPLRLEIQQDGVVL